jgi:hypothetical protein
MATAIGTGSLAGLSLLKDEQKLEQINKMLTDEQPFSCGEVITAVKLFKGIQSEKIKLKAFEKAISSGRSLNLKIVRPSENCIGDVFYKNLPKDLQLNFKTWIWIANDKSNRGFEQCEGIANYILECNRCLNNSDLVKTAIKRMVASYK